MVRAILSWLGMLALSLAACAAPNAGPAAVKAAPGSAPTDLRRQAMDGLRAGVAFADNAAVRVAAIEALAEADAEDCLPWIRTALLDEHPAVRFAGAIAIGTLNDSVAEAKIRDLAGDADAGVRVAALYALHRLGDPSRTTELGTMLLTAKEPVVRRHAAWVLGMLGEPGSVKVLASAMRDSDGGVRHYALEAMARLGNPEARQELAFMANSGVGAEEVFAISALAETRDKQYAELYQYKLANALHEETKLAGARALGMIGMDEGYAEALMWTHSRPAALDDAQETAEDRALRVRQLALRALGAIGRREALPALARSLRDDRDPRVQVAAAGAMLLILNREREATPFGTRR